MANIYLPNNTICNSIAHNIAYNANYDIVWSFDYSLSGNTSSQGSFTTFLFDGDSLSGGGPGIGGAYYSPGSFLSGGNSIFSTPVVSAIIGINFDTTGLFALSGNSVSKGILSAIPNSLTVRYGQTNFEYLTSVALTSPERVKQTLQEVSNSLDDTIDRDSALYSIHNLGKINKKSWEKKTKSTNILSHL